MSDKLGLYIIMETVAGSNLYGTSTPESDIDYRGVCFEPWESILGLHPFEQLVETKDVDRTIYGLRKFCQLALDNNPNIVELLFAPVEGGGMRVINPPWMTVLSNREHFLSRKIAKTFVGYAISQAKRIEGHHRWLTGNPPEKPDPFDYGMYYSANQSPNWLSQDRKQAYDSALKHYQQYQTWLANRNPKRFALEEKWGYDTKHGMHLVRLLEQGEELLTTGNLTLPRPNAKRLLEIRNGALKYEELMSWMESQIDNINSLTETSVLPSKPNFNKIHYMVMELNYDYTIGY